MHTKNFPNYFSVIFLWTLYCTSFVSQFTSLLKRIFFSYFSLSLSYFVDTDNYLYKHLPPISVFPTFILLFFEYDDTNNYALPLFFLFCCWSMEKDFLSFFFDSGKVAEIKRWKDINLVLWLFTVHNFWHAKHTLQWTKSYLYNNSDSVGITKRFLFAFVSSPLFITIWLLVFTFVFPFPWWNVQNHNPRVLEQ